MRTRSLIIALFLALPTLAGAQSITTVSLARDQIALVKTAQGITTRISFQEQVKEIICGDLYDANSGKGSFVVQRGDSDVFLKPIPSKGFSNLFVKTGERGEHVYSFDLRVVPPEQAHRVVNVVDGSVDQPRPQVVDTLAENETRDNLKHQGEEILRSARQQAGRIIAEAEQRASDLERQAAQRADQEAERRFISALILGLKEIKISNPRVVAKRVVVATDQKVLVFDGRAYLRYTIQNTGDSDFEYSSISLESGQAGNSQSVAIEVVQSKSENKLAPGESLAGIIVFDPKVAEAKLTLYVRANDNAEIARVNIVQQSR